MTTHIGRTDNETLKKNLDVIVERIKSGETTIDTEIKLRQIELRHLENMLNATSGYKQHRRKNIRIRIEYIEREVTVLSTLLLLTSE